MISQQRIMLNGSWNMQNADGSLKCPAEIPGSVLSAAVRHGILDDPYYRMNEYDTREFLRQDFIFTKTFHMEKQAGFTYELCCDGIDTAADLYINDILVQKVNNMHLRHRILCPDVLKNGENTIKIYIHSALRYIEDYVPQPGKEIHYTPCGAMAKNQYIRKAHSMFGWDWGPQLPDMGIWRDIFIRGFAYARLETVKIRQTHENGSVQLLADSFVKLTDGREIPVSAAYSHKSSDSVQDTAEILPSLCIELTLITPDGTAIPFTDDRCSVPNPQLWWPNRYGAQPLYTVKAALYADGRLHDELSYRIGLRTLTVSREKDLWGEEFAFCVNGIKIFAKGANYIPQDCIYSNITQEKIRILLDAAADSGFNCIRIWGGGYYPSDEFYDYCDERGLIVWQDFMYACNIYELTDEFRQSITAETKDNARRLRHHASLGLWCGNNEIESAWDHWADFCTHPDALRQDYLKMFEQIIPDTLRSEDPATFYWPSSPSSGGGIKDPDCDNVGDRHYWDVWHGEKPFSDYENYYFRFCSEFGFQSFPCAKTIETFTIPEDRNIFTEVMESHQKNGSANGKILRYISDTFLYPKDFESLIYISQILQGMAIKEGVEHWRRHRGRCMGTIYWQLNDNWPVASWSSIDYFGRWKALQYMARHFYADISGSLQVSENAWYTPYVQNETMSDTQTELMLYVKTMDGKILHKQTGHIKCPALGTASMETISLEKILAGKESDVFVEALFHHSDGTLSHQVKTPKPYKHMHLKKAQITCACTREKDLLRIKIKSSVPAFFVEIQTDIDMVLSDNFMHITDNAEYEVTGKLPDGYEGLPKISARSLCDSY